MTVYISAYPPAQNSTYVKATTEYAGFVAYWATDPTKSLTGTQTGNIWFASTNTNQRFHIDLGEAKIISRLYYENGHHLGGTTNYGAKNFTIQGSNTGSAFAELTYATNTNWTDLTTDVSQFDIHVSADQADPKYVLITSPSSYRYYAIKIADNWGNAFMGVRRFELQYTPTTGGIQISDISDYGIL
jgi:hypothetical protein